MSSLNQRTKTLINQMEFSVNTQEIINEIQFGLSKSQKELPPKLFYDEAGSILFEQITELDEYYPTRTESKILHNNIQEISSLIDDDSILIEYGAGSSEKTKILLDNFSNLCAYVAIDISRDYLYNVANNLRDTYPALNIFSIAADYTKSIDFSPIQDLFGKRIAFYPGSTIGNFYPDEAVNFLSNVRNEIGNNGAMIIGVDLHKEEAILNAAYNDDKKVTENFNLNMLQNINNNYGGNFNLDLFSHHAFYNQEDKRIEMHLISNKNQLVVVSGKEFAFQKNESIRTEVSHKYTLDGFSALANQANFRVGNVWVDENKLFSVQYLIANPQK